MRVLIVGAGQIGSRHLQSLAQVDANTEIVVMDPSPDSLSVAKQRYDVVSTKDSPKNVILTNQHLNKKSTFDLCIVATGSRNRLDIISELIDRYNIRRFVLEKVLFQSVPLVEEASTVIRAAAIPTWVNCPRRMFPIYHRLKEQLSDAHDLQMRVSGVDWGLACNAIHFIDLWAFLSGQSEYSIQVDGLEPKIFPSKRPGYSEVFGSIVGSSSNAQFELCCKHTSEAETPLLVEIQTSRDSLLVNESERICTFTEGNLVSETIPFDAPYQSQLTNIVVHSLATSGKCQLTSFEESCALHAPLLAALLRFFNAHGENRYTECPIT